MCAHSAAVACHCDVHAITDVDTELPIPSLQYETTERRLMLWTLEACLRYIESDDFDRDTIMLDVDQLIYGDLSHVFNRKADLSVLVRATAKHMEQDGGQPLLNGVQFWRAKAKKRLIPFYQQALDIARTLPEDRIVWGADTDAVRRLIEPIELGNVARAGLHLEMVDAERVIETFSDRHAEALAEGRSPWPARPVLDFRWMRKPNMPAVYRATFAQGAVA
ncbi:MAG TPA: hypothetical protein VF422_09955 [Dokdonella sp.]